MGILSQLRIDIYFVEYGYQVDIHDNQGTADNPDAGWLVTTLCRDFGDSHAVTKLKTDMVRALEEMLDKFRFEH